MRISPIQNTRLQSNSLKIRKRDDLYFTNGVNFQNKVLVKNSSAGLSMAALCTAFMNRLVSTNLNMKDSVEWGAINEGIIKSKKNDTSELHQQKLSILEKAFSREELKNHKKVREAMFLLLRDGGDAQVGYTASVVDLIASNELLYKNENIQDNFSDITYTNLWDFDDRKALLEKYIESPELSDVECVKNSIGDIVAHTNSWYQKNIAMKVLETPELYENENIVTNLGNSFLGVSGFLEDEDFDSKIDLLDLFTGTESLQDHPVIANNIGEVVAKTDKNNAFLVTLASDKNLLEVDNFAKVLPSLMNCVDNANKLNTLQEMLNFKDLWEKGLPMLDILNSVNNEHQADIVRIILSHEKLQTQPVLDNINSINARVIDLASKNIALDLLSNKDVLNDKEILKGFPILINKARTNSQVREDIDICLLIDNDISELKNLVNTYRTQL